MLRESLAVQYQQTAARGSRSFLSFLTGAGRWAWLRGRPRAHRHVLSGIPISRLRVIRLTFAFLGFTHYCGKRRSNGAFTVWRKTAKKRMVAKLQAIKAELRRRMHEPIADVGA